MVKMSSFLTDSSGNQVRQSRVKKSQEQHAHILVLCKCISGFRHLALVYIRSIIVERYTYIYIFTVY